MSSEGGESITASLSSKSSDPDEKKEKRRSATADEVETCISSFLQKVPEIAQHFDIVDVLGDGTFSCVFHGRKKSTSEGPSYALKYIIPTSATWRIAAEVEYLQRLGGKHHVCGILSLVRHHDNVVLILPYIKATRFNQVVQASNQVEIQRYMRALFEALAHVHRHNVIHRDVKPSNFLYDRENNRFLLVDFGLAEDLRNDVDKENRQTNGKRKTVKPEFTLIHKLPRSKDGSFKERPSRVTSDRAGSRATDQKEKTSKSRSSSRSSRNASTDCSHPLNEICNTCFMKPAQEASRAGTPGFRSPEMLMKHPNQTTAVDIWAAGVIFLSLLSGRYPFFKAADDLNSLCQIITLLGSESVVNASRAIGKILLLHQDIIGYEIRIACTIMRESSHIAHCVRCSEVKAADDRSRMCPLQPIVSTAFSLLTRCLDPNPFTRITAEQALKHEFFETLPPPPLSRKLL